MKTVTVNVGPGYDIRIGGGLLGQTGKALLCLGGAGKAVVVTDTTVSDLYGLALANSLQQSGFTVKTRCLPPGEQQKTLANAGDLYTWLAESYADRSTPLLAVGGGVIGDLAGFVAATYMRGLPLVQLPTTLLAQVDSSIGGKVAVDHGQLKNMVGAFYQPRLVIADTTVLKSLTARQLSNGLAEVIKYAVIQDAVFFEFLETNIDRILAGEQELLAEIVFRSTSIKARIVEQDEKDTGLRNILNFGHTAGHAIESVSNFTVSHGEAVALGMLVAGRISQHIGIFSRAGLARLENLIQRAGLLTELPALPKRALLEAIQHDKKAVQGKIKYILAEDIGKAVISNEVTLPIIEAALFTNEKT